MSACCHCLSQEPNSGTGACCTKSWRRLSLAGLLAAQSLIVSFVVNLSAPMGTARLVLDGTLAISAILVFLLIGIPLLRAAAGAAIEKRVSFEQLFLLGIAGVFGASVQGTITGQGQTYYEVVAILPALYTLGSMIGIRRREQAIASARAFGEEFDRCEKVGAGGRASPATVAAILPGDVVHVPAGGGIPVDGVVIEGAAFVKETSLTGEPLPVVKRPGDAVLAGSYAVDHSLRVQAIAAGNARKLDDLLAIVRRAQESPAPIQREADRLLAWFLPTVFVIAAIVFVFWTWRAGWVTGLFNFLSVILVACPWSMGLATPLGIRSAMADLARHGLMAGTSEIVERLAAVNTVVFDKGEILNDGGLEVVDFLPAPGFDRETMLTEVAAVESSSVHPIARAFRERGGVAAALGAREVAMIAGAGVHGWVDLGDGGAHIEVGNSRLLTASDARRAADALRLELRGRDGAPHEVVVLRDRRLAAMAILRERLCDQVRPVIERLEKLNVKCTVIAADGECPGAEPGSRKVAAGLSPTQKARLIRGMKANEPGLCILFAGDSVTDAAVMAAADAALSTSAGRGGHAREAAQGELAGGNLFAIPYGIRRCRDALRAIRQNLCFAAAFNVIGMGLAATGTMNPVLAAFLMVAARFTVTWTPLRGRGEDDDTALIAGGCSAEPGSAASARNSTAQTAPANRSSRTAAEERA